MKAVLLSIARLRLDSGDSLSCLTQVIQNAQTQMQMNTDTHSHQLTSSHCAVKLCPKEGIYKLQYNVPPSDSKRLTALYWW